MRIKLSVILWVKDQSNTMPVLTDKEIIEQFKDPANRDHIFSVLVKKYQERLYWHCRKILIQHEDADDALQNTFVKVWKNLSDFRSDSELFTWLYRIATNESLTVLKQKKNMSRIYKSPQSNVPLFFNFQFLI